MVAAGKSSIINTFLSALDPDGRTVISVPTGMNPDSLTQELQDFNPTSPEEYPVIPGNAIHGVAFIFDMITVGNISGDKMKHFQEFQTIAAQKCGHRVVIGTKFEKLAIKEKNHAWIYEYKPLQQKFEQFSASTGMDKQCMFVVSNQWNGDHITMIKCILALYALENMIRNIDRYLKITA
ncbi:uncharacterized protein LOC129693414 isoform X2 [Leucoraja erinacea]|uniref:uncharacterized protein LOC129693414 isoform X2 n=1 Tax=Leucoraja erinaceus TaxID=7782 RepID=UPI0024543108|nr:uncharacterized protein LOC129693414 isoform X2 [Leucoraja erinacea]